MLIGHCYGRRKGKKICAALSWQNAKVIKESEGEQGLILVCLKEYFTECVFSCETPASVGVSVECDIFVWLSLR